MKKFIYELISWFAAAGMLVAIGVWWHEILIWTVVNTAFPILKFALWLGGGNPTL